MLRLRSPLSDAAWPTLQHPGLGNRLEEAGGSVQAPQNGGQCGQSS